MIAVSAVIGQIIFFRVGRATVLRRLGWDDVDGERVDRILAVVLQTIRAAIAVQRAGRAAR